MNVRKESTGTLPDDMNEEGKMQQDPPQIAIVIPFFQREAGLLAQCVRSILEQPGKVKYQIIVVDDGSPISADDELAAMREEAADRLTIVRQPNSGPGAARNTGLDHVPEGTPFVTFLDSDDHWTGPFLDDAIHALEQGYDLFMGNSTRAGQEKTRFEWGADKGLDLRPGDHPVIDMDRDIHGFQGDFFDLLVRRTNLIGPTTFAYRFARFPGVRFDPTIFNGQDRLFKLTLGQHLDKVAFSPRLYAQEGEGVNIFDKSQWGSEGSVRLSSSYIRLGKTILQQINLSPQQEHYVRGHLSEARHAFLASLLHVIRRRLPVDWPRVLATFRDDPTTLLLLPTNLVRVLRNKAAS